MCETRARSAGGGDPRRRHVDVVEPAPLVGRLAREQAEERVLQRLGDRSPLAGADRQPVDRANGGDLHRGAGEERSEERRVGKECRCRWWTWRERRVGGGSGGWGSGGERAGDG